MKNKFGKFDSWDIYDDNIAIKHCDKSFFIHKGSGIPIEIRWYFNVENLNLGEKKNIKLYYNDLDYNAYISKESGSIGRTRIFWYSDLSNIFNENQKNSQKGFPSIRFEKIRKDNYSVLFINLNEIDEEENDNLESAVEFYDKKEGKKIARYITLYERKPKNRKEAIKIHGTKCMACGFNFEKVYGDYGKNFIEVHHIKPLFELNSEISVDPKNDLICLCSNCHRIVHLKKNKVLTLVELKEIIQRNIELAE